MDNVEKSLLYPSNVYRLELYYHSALPMDLIACLKEYCSLSARKLECYS